MSKKISWSLRITQRTPTYVSVFGTYTTVFQPLQAYKHTLACIYADAIRCSVTTLLNVWRLKQEIYFTSAGRHHSDVLDGDSCLITGSHCQVPMPGQTAWRHPFKQTNTAKIQAFLNIKSSFSQFLKHSIFYLFKRGSDISMR